MKCKDEHRPGYHEEYYQKNKERMDALHKRYFVKWKGDVFALLGGRCSICGIDDIRVLQIDHINGGGTMEKRELGYAAKDYRYYKRIFDLGGKGYQILCANCNWIKRAENKEGPH